MLKLGTKGNEKIKLVLRNSCPKKLQGTLYNSKGLQGTLKNSLTKKIWNQSEVFCGPCNPSYREDRV